MLEKGQTPPNIREDINDVPPNPSAPPPGARMKPRPKPWEHTASKNGAAASAFPAAANGALPAHAGGEGLLLPVQSRYVALLCRGALSSTFESKNFTCPRLS